MAADDVDRAELLREAAHAVVYGERTDTAQVLADDLLAWAAELDPEWDGTEEGDPILRSVLDRVLDKIEADNPPPEPEGR